MKKYALYTARNIFQIRKSHEDAKLNRDLRNVAKIYLKNIKIFDNDESQIGNIKKDEEKRDKEDINVLTSDLYSYTIAITRMHWKK